MINWQPIDTIPPTGNFLLFFPRVPASFLGNRPGPGLPPVCRVGRPSDFHWRVATHWAEINEPGEGQP